MVCVCLSPTDRKGGTSEREDVHQQAEMCVCVSMSVGPDYETHAANQTSTITLNGVWGEKIL